MVDCSSFLLHVYNNNLTDAPAEVRETVDTSHIDASCNGES